MKRKKTFISPYNLAVHLAALGLVAWLALDAANANLTANPIQKAQQRTGDYAILFLLASLACTPINTIFAWRPAINLRRPLGVYAFLFAALHFYLFIGVDYGFDLELIWLDVSDKPYIFAGLAGLLLLLPLAATSWNWWKKKLGKTWKTLHKLVYLAGIVVVFHLAWVIKGNVSTLTGDIWKPLLAGTVLTLELVARIPRVRRWIVATRGRIGSSRSAREGAAPELIGQHGERKRTAGS